MVKKKKQAKEQRKELIKKAAVKVEAEAPRDYHMWSRDKKLRQGPNKGNSVWRCELCKASHVEKGDTPSRPVRGCRKGVSATTAGKVAVDETLPCMHCGEKLTASNRSVKVSGAVVHVGCKKAPKEESGTVEWMRNREQTRATLQGLPKHKGVKTPEPPKEAPRSKYGFIMAVSDYQGRTAIQLDRNVSTVTFVPFDTAGMHLTYMQTNKFDERYKPLEKYPVEKAAQKYADFCKDYGATQDVLDWLARVVNIKPEDADMAKKKLATKSSGGGTTSSGGGAKASRATGGGERKETAASLFQQLIMAPGGRTDEQIFKEVQKKFGLDDKKRGYVAWYRNHLKKAGKNPPAPKEDKSAAKAAPKKGDAKKKAKGKKAA